MDIRYAAGYFDGEGCICISSTKKVRRGSKGYSLTALVSQKEPMILKQFQERWGGSISTGSKGAQQWRVSASLAEVFLRDIEPHLVQKRLQAKLALAFRERCFRIREGSVKRLTREELVDREVFKQTMSVLNART